MYYLNTIKLFTEHNYNVFTEHNYNVFKYNKVISFAKRKKNQFLPWRKFQVIYAYKDWGVTRWKRRKQPLHCSTYIFRHVMPSSGVTFNCSSAVVIFVILYLVPPQVLISAISTMPKTYVYTPYHRSNKKNDMVLICDLKHFWYTHFLQGLVFILFLTLFSC